MKPVLIVGGAGFIGTNLAVRLLADGQRVIAFDNLSRAGVEQNLRWLLRSFGDRLEVEIGDVRDSIALQRVVAQASAVYHFAAQTAVTTSVLDPATDFDVNARGTLRLLEAVRACPRPPALLFTSTNKVYGSLGDVELRASGERYEPVDSRLRAEGVDEGFPLDFHTPYGCSKGTADQYVLEYARGYGIPATVFRMSCIYGPHQCGNEDQGWVAHFALRALEERPVSIYGDGMQVRDLLYVDDLVDALMLARRHIDRLAGHAFNIGGGVERTASLRQVIACLRRLHGHCEVEYEDWRPSDQRYYVSDTRKFERATGWRPRMSVQQGIAALYDWLEQTHGLRAPRSSHPHEGTFDPADVRLGHEHS